MTPFIAQVLFLLLLAVAGWLLGRRIRFIRAAIGLGKPEQRNDQPAARWRNMLLVAFGQRKMFKKPIPALLHLFVYCCTCLSTWVSCLSILKCWK